MLADPLTKVMAEDRLTSALSSGVFDMPPTKESLAIKERNRVGRKTKRECEKQDKQVGDQAVPDG